MEIAGKVFIVTGGASGLGEGTARMLASKGGKVVIADMQADKGEVVAQAIGGAFVKCDVSSEADAQAVVACATGLGKLMGLVNCAGIAPAEKTVGKTGPHALALFSKCISVNLIGSFNMIRLAADAMSKNAPESTGERGVLISTASVAAYDGQIGQAAYSASKGGMLSMVRSLADALGADGIRVNSVSPGQILTPMVAPIVEANPGMFERRILLGRLGQPEELGRVVRFLLSEEASYINASEIVVDGGNISSQR